MPVAHFHLVDGTFDSAQQRRLLIESSRCYSEVLGSPIDRVRIFVVPYSPAGVAVGGTVVTDGSEPAPYFTAIVLAGRPLRQRHELLARFTDLCVEILGTPRKLVRGRIIEVQPENWGIAGEAASSVRAEEIVTRSASAL